MKAWFQKLIDISSIASTEVTLRQALPELAQELGFNCYAYLNVHPVRTFAVSNYPGEWQDRYLRFSYAEIDPVVSKARDTMMAFTWMAGKPTQAASKTVRKFYSEAGDYGIRSGVSIPVRTAFGHMSMLTLATDRPSLVLDRDIDQVAAVTAVTLLHSTIERQETAPTARTTVELTAKQVLCLAWSAEGKTMRDIAAIEGMSYATVNFHLNNARRTLEANSLAQATALGTKLRLI